MPNLISLLTLFVFCLGMTGNVFAQREVAPPANTPLDSKPAASRPVQATSVPTAAETKSAPKPAQSAQNQPDKVNKNTRPAPVQASTLPTVTKIKSAPKPVQSAKTQPEKAKKTVKPTTAKEVAAKPQAQKSTKACKTNTKQEPRKVAKAKKETTKTAKKPAQKRVLPAATIPVE